MCGKKWIVLTLCGLLASLMGTPALGDDPALVGWWKLDDGAGTVATDSSGNGNHGNLVGTLDWVDGIIGGGLHFDGTTAQVDIPPSSSLTVINKGDFSCMVWLKTDALDGTNQYAFQQADLNGNGRSWLFIAGDNEIRSYVGNNTTGSGVYVQAQTWYHAGFVVTENGAADSVQMYVNGVPEGAATQWGMEDCGGGFYMGAHKGLAADTRWTGILDDLRVYSRALTQEEIQTAMLGIPPEVASNPYPVDKSTDVSRDTPLTWQAGEFAQTHDIYLGTVVDAVESADRGNPMGVLLSQGQATTEFDPSRLDFGQTYYWRIDEVNAAPDSTIFKGDIWSFTVEPMAYPIGTVVATSNATSDPTAGPENTVNGSGLNAVGEHSTEAADMWLGTGGAEPIWIQFGFDRIYKLHEMRVWNYNVQFEAVLGFGLRDVSVEYSIEGIEWTTQGDVELARATATPTYTANTTVDFGGASARYVRLTVSSGWGMMGQYGLSEVRFTYIPVQPRDPQPVDGATEVDPATILSWRAGREADTHEIYLGIDPDALTIIDTVDQATYTADLNFGDTYYWQVVEVNEGEAVSAWAGDVWSLSTLEYALIDGFDEYDDDIDARTTIFDTWLDGWVNETGSTVGYFDAPFAEKTIVRSGGQSMPLQYENTVSPFYSEAERIFDSAQDWTVNGADTLAVYFQGVPGPFAELPSGKIVLGAAGTDIWNTTDECRLAYKSLSGNGSIVAYVESVANTNAWAKGGVMIRETLDAGSMFAAVYSTPGNGCRYQGRLVTDASAVSDTAVATPEQIALRAPHWVKIERVGNDFNGYYSTDGENWTSMSWNPQTIAMASDVYIGLVLTSHAAGVLGSAEFSDAATAGNVSGQWTVATIGPEQPEGNATSPLYVTLEDATGKSATVSHPAGDAAVILGGWNEWAIPMSDFAGVNLSRIEVMKIGVGNPANPTAGGTGIVYFDDLGYGKPATTE